MNPYDKEWMFMNLYDKLINICLNVEKPIGSFLEHSEDKTEYLNTFTPANVRKMLELMKRLHDIECPACPCRFTDLMEEMINK